jgi:hypothetical protein
MKASYSGQVCHHSDSERTRCMSFRSTSSWSQLTAVALCPKRKQFVLFVKTELPNLAELVFQWRPLIKCIACKVIALCRVVLPGGDVYVLMPTLSPRGPPPLLATSTDRRNIDRNPWQLLRRREPTDPEPVCQETTQRTYILAAARFFRILPGSSLPESTFPESSRDRFRPRHPRSSCRLRIAMYVPPVQPNGANFNQRWWSLARR